LYGALEVHDGFVSFKGKQGEAMGRPGVVAVSVEVKDGRVSKVQVGGDVRIAFKTEIEI